MSILGVILVLLTVVPLLVDLGSNVINVMVTLFTYIIFAQSWNLIGGYAGQVNLGIAAFFGVSTMVTHFFWKTGLPICAAMAAGCMASVVLAVIIGLPTLRLRGMYFAVGTLALAQAAQIVAANIFTKAVSMPGSFSTSYSLMPRYYLGLGLATAATFVVFLLVRSKAGLAMLAIRDDEQAAEVTGVRILKYKILALIVSAVLVGLAGGLFAYVRLSIWNPSSVFGPAWTFDAMTAVIIGGAGTIVGPLIGSAFLVILSELFANTLGQAHLIVFGFLFILVVLFMPRGLMGGTDLRRLFVHSGNRRDTHHE